MSLQMRLHAAFSGRSAWTSAQKIRDLMATPRSSAAVPHEMYQVNHVVRSEVTTGDGTFTVHSLVPATDAPRDTPLDICLYLHGGGYVEGMDKHNWAFVGELASAGAGMKVIVPDYGLAPEFGADEAARLLDVVYDDAAAEARATGHRLVLAGDSAGAGLALGWLLDRSTTEPGGTTDIERVALISPWLDASCDTSAAGGSDPVLSVDALRVAGDSWGRGSGVRALPASALAASDAQLSQLPPVRVWTGTRDVLHADALALARRAGDRVTLTTSDGALHNYPLLPVPEGRDARREVGGWLTDGPAAS